MSVSNISQILLRNISLFNSQQPLFINLSADAFIDEFLTHYSDAQLTTFNSNFLDYEQHQINTRYQSIFSATYKSDIKHDLVVIRYPKTKAELPFILAMLNNQLTFDADIILVGEKSGGINSSKNIVKDHLNNYQKYDAARHCMIFTGNYIFSDKAFELNQWFTQYKININNITLNIAALPGVFSHKKLDVGTQILLENIPENLTGQTLDFGCGAGVIGSYLAKKNNISLDLTDVSALALASTSRTLELNQLTGEVFATNSLSNINKIYSNVITNPPFHQGIKTNYEATEQFLSGIAKYIINKGQLIVVANNFLTYRPFLENNFKQVQNITNEQGFLVYHAIK